MDGPVEIWLCLIEDEMRRTLRKLMLDTKMAQKKQKREKWIQTWPGQLVLTISQLSWTADCVKALAGTDKTKTPKKGLKSLFKKQVSMLNKLTESVRATKDKTMIKKLVALITVEVKVHTQTRGKK